MHIASAFTPDNRFGGPTRLALDLTRELRQRGHDAMVLGAAVGYRVVPVEIDGVPVRLVRGVLPPGPLGWAALVAPGLRRVVREEMRDADLVHIHLARDLVTLGAALAARKSGVPYVIQTHGMLDGSDSRLASLVDVLATRPAVSGARLALPLTEDERSEIDRLSAGAVQAPLFGNGVRIDSELESSTVGSEILFIARLHPRKGGAAFARAATAVSEWNPSARFGIIGPDEGDLAEIKKILEAHPKASVRVIGAVPPSEVRRRLATARAYVLPAVREPFGLTVVEAMSAGRPVVLHASAALAPVVERAGAGWTFGEGGTFQRLEDALQYVITESQAVEVAGARALTLAKTKYSIELVVDELLKRYENAVPGG